MYYTLRVTLNTVTMITYCNECHAGLCKSTLFFFSAPRAQSGVLLRAIHHELSIFGLGLCSTCSSFSHTRRHACRPCVHWACAVPLALSRSVWSKSSFVWGGRTESKSESKFLNPNLNSKCSASKPGSNYLI